MRLTKKYKEDYFVNQDNKELIKLDIENDHNSSQIIRNKLGKLEDIEEELGIDLITLFKALKNGIYWKCENDIEYDEVEFGHNWYSDKNTPKSYFLSGDTIHLFSEYGKTWALTKKELE